MSLRAMPISQPNASGPSARDAAPGAPGRDVWLFFGRAPFTPTVGDLRLLLADLAPDAEVGTGAEAPDAPGDLKPLDDEAGVTDAPIRVQLRGMVGELVATVREATAEWQRHLEGLSLVGATRGGALGLVAQLDALDQGPTRAYRELVRPFLCALGELLPGSVAARDGDARGFSTDGMRAKLPTTEARRFRLDGSFSFPGARMGRVQRIVEAHAILRAIGRVDGRNLVVAADDLSLPEGLWAYLYRDLLRLGRSARGGTIRIACEGTFNSVLHATGGA